MNEIQWKPKWNWHILIHRNAFENVVWKMAAILSRHLCIKFQSILPDTPLFMHDLDISIILMMHFWCRVWETSTVAIDMTLTDMYGKVPVRHRNLTSFLKECQLWQARPDVALANNNHIDLTHLATGQNGPSTTDDYVNKNCIVKIKDIFTGRFWYHALNWIRPYYASQFSITTI